jgi:hypothetical protein
VSKNSLWADVDDDITLDQDEFNELFVESSDVPKKNVPEKNALKNSSSSPTNGGVGLKTNSKIKVCIYIYIYLYIQIYIYVYVYMYI